MESWNFDSRGPESMRRMGAALGRSIGADGLVIGLIGPLGAGKTVFVKGLAEGLGVDPRLVSSPTFVIAQQYRLPEGPITLHHIDLYRLEHEEELETIGFEDMLAPGCVLAVEWADRFPGVLGRRVLTIEFEGPSAAEEEAAREGVPPRGRTAHVVAKGDHAERILEDWARRCEAADATDATDATDADGAPSGGGGTGPDGPSRARVANARLACLAALCLWAASVVGPSRAVDSGLPLDRVPPAPGCETMRSLTEDALGTARAACAPEGRRAGSLSGVARWLAGESVDLNRASTALLQALPGIGPVRAAAIIEARRERPFDSLRDLERVPGIGPRTRERLEVWLHVSNAASVGSGAGRQAEGRHDG